MVMNAVRRVSANPTAATTVIRMNPTSRLTSGGSSQAKAA